MHDFMSQLTKTEVPSQLRRRSVSAGRKHKRQLITQVVALLGYHRKATIRVRRHQTQTIHRTGTPFLPAARGSYCGVAAHPQTHLVRRLPTLRQSLGGVAARMGAGVRTRSSPVGGRTALQSAGRQRPHLGSAAGIPARRATPPPRYRDIERHKKH